VPRHPSFSAIGPPGRGVRSIKATLALSNLALLNVSPAMRCAHTISALRRTISMFPYFDQDGREATIGSSPPTAALLHGQFGAHLAEFLKITVKSYGRLTWLSH
jgi:hypothetical protein